MRVRLLSWNVHGCVGRRGRLDPQRTARAIAALAPDVAALQEVAIHPDGATDFPALLAKVTGLRVLLGPTLADRRGDYGNALLTRLPVAAWRRHDLSVPGREPRGVIEAELVGTRRRLRVLATHLGLSARERRLQMRRLLALTERDLEGTVVLAGDLNEWFAWGRPLAWLQSRFGRPPAPRTYPAACPLLSLDRVWVHPPGRLAGVRAVAAPTVMARASDHLPLVAIVEC